jgi:hypothetical protein
MTHAVADFSKYVMIQPRIAVAIPTHARKEMLFRLISSLPHDWQIFVSDNNASLAPLEAPLGPHVSVSHCDRLIPMFANWNRAISLVGDGFSHVFIPSDDDIYLPTARTAVADALVRYPDADILVFGCDFFNEHDKRWSGYCPSAHEALSPGYGFLKFIRGVDARMPGVLFRKAFLNSIGAFDDRFELTAADSELIQRAALLGRTVFVPTVIGLYRIWSGSLTNSRQATKLWMDEVDVWTEKIAHLLSNCHELSGHKINLGRFRDEIFVANLRAGIGALKARSNYFGAWRHLLANRYPYRASLLSQAKLLIHLLLPFRK